HQWQHSVVSRLKDELEKAAAANVPLLADLLRSSYDDLARSITAAGLHLPTFAEADQEARLSLKKGQLKITKVNSEQDVMTLLDESGQLRLATPLNIFIGGQILDRGLTISGVIGFFYGRRPNRFQQDTVLQHSRMYGYRPLEDLAVTRFYTS